MRISDWSSTCALPIWAGSAPRRLGADSVSDPAAARLAATIPDRIKNDDPAGAEMLLNAAIDQLSPAARAEWTQKVAWSYYIENDDQNALRLSLACTAGGRSEEHTSELPSLMRISYAVFCLQ